jgi:hypothetical protein
MKVGMFTGLLNDELLNSVPNFAEDAGIPCLEVWAGPGSKHSSHLRHAGHEGLLSIEHEDETQSMEEGSMRGAAFLEQFG